ncbi:hypothetical protein TeGR_g12203 [Tetraparma gracilis]|uniref:Uncharacterized protein n=1 Tax=Tetraparma gracilis TaxID=2962635 RepID=A0ABQ6MKZ7_9STRA|nr:hypothetical protein TeGR_g12203 [Tetraparma gracilis]
MEKTGTSLIHTKREELRSLFVEALDQALPSPTSTGAPPPADIVHALPEKDAVVLLYRNLAVRNMGGMTSTELFEFHLRVAEDPKDPNLVTLRTLSDDEARRLCGDALHDRFARYKEVDEATLRHFVEHGMTAAPESSEKEKALVLRRLQDDDQDDSSWSRLGGTVREPVSYFKRVDEDSNTWGKAEGVVDASAPDVLAWLWHLCTHERNLRHERKNGNLLKMELDVPGTRSKFMVASTKMPGAISNRVTAMWWTWAKDQNGDLIAAFSPHEDFGLGAEKQIVDTALEAEKRSVLGRLRGFYRIKTLAFNVCRVTLVAQGSLGGSFTKQAMAWAVKSLLGMVKTLQDKYMRNGAKVDAEIRGAFPAPPLRRSITSEQNALVARCLTLEKGAEGSNVMAAVGTNSAAAQAKAVRGSWVELKSTSPIALGKAKATLDCSAREAFAYQFAVSKNDNYTPAENAVVDRVRDKLDSIPDSSFEKFESPDHFVHMKGFHKGGKNGTPRASTVLDEDICTYLSKMRKRFDRSLELDVKKRGELVKMIRRHGRDGVEYSEEEEKIVAGGLTWFKAFDGLKSKDVAMRSPQTKGKVAYKKGDSRAWGWSTATVRGSPEEVLAHVWDTKARNKTSPDDLEKEIDEQPNDHNQLVFNKKQTPAVISNRDFLGRAVWKDAEGGVDAMRVVSNTEMHEHHAMDAKTELVATKMAEMFCESIPGCVLQVYALIQGGSRDKMGTKVLSIVVSAITTGMGSAAISYDFDSDPENRRKLPDFYGYLPDEGNKRTVMYVCMVLNGALLLLLRSVGAALLMLANTEIFVAYLAGDHLLYLLQKLVRGDFLYWMPVEGVGELAVSLLVRVTVKTLTDFTGVIQFRGAA